MESKQYKPVVNNRENKAQLPQTQAKSCVLIFDDNDEILFLCKKLLENLYRVETLTRCENVISDIELLKPDLILMDLWIPEIGGEKATSLIKSNPATQHIPVIMFSANAKIDVISSKINANGYIIKPFDIHELKEKIAANI